VNKWYHWLTLVVGIEVAIYAYNQFLAPASKT